MLTKSISNTFQVTQSDVKCLNESAKYEWIYVSTFALLEKKRGDLIYYSSHNLRRHCWSSCVILLWFFFAMMNAIKSLEGFYWRA